jgi:hypothetical protein
MALMCNKCNKARHAKHDWPTDKQCECADYLALPKCSICGQPREVGIYGSATQGRLDRKEICFGCDFWIEKVLWKTEGDPKAVIVNGRHYYIGEEQEKGYGGFRGFGGSEFKIKFNDGRRVVSHNLWCQGDVPAHFRDVLTDNAVFEK